MEETNMNKKKLLALLMALVMVLTLVPVTALAEDVVEFTEVSTAEELTSALANPTVSAIKLADNADIISVSAAMMISRDLIIDGNGKNITSSAARGFRINTDGVTVTIKNLTISGGEGFERAIQVDSGLNNVSLTIENVTATATMYTVNICGGVTNLTMTITDSELTGWGAVNLWGNSGTVNISDSTLIGINDKGYNADGWNDFGVILLEGDTTGQTDEHSADYDVTVTNCDITARSTTGNTQYVLLHNNPSANNRLTLDSCNITLDNVNGNCEFFCDNSTGSVTKVKPKTGENLPELSAYYAYSAFDNEGYSTINGTVAFLCNVDGENLSIVESFGTLQDAFDAAQNGQLVYLYRDVVQNEGILFDKTDATVEFWMGGNTLTVNNGSNVNNRAIRIDNGTLEVYDGSIVAVGSGTTSSNGAGCYGAFRVEANGELIAHDLTLSNARPWGLNVKVLGGKATLTDVTINSSYGGGIEVTEADLGTQSKKGEATLTDCTFTQTGYFDHCSTAVSVSGGSKLTVNSGTYTGEYALYVFSSGGVIDIKDGTFTGRGNTTPNNEVRPAIVAAIDLNTYPTYTGGLTISGGRFNGTYDIKSPAYMSITGGVFETDPSAYVADGYEAVALTENNIGTIDVSYIDWYKVGKVQMGELAEGETITTGTSETVTYTAPKTVVATDEENHELSSTDNVSVTVTTNLVDNATSAPITLDNIKDKSEFVAAVTSNTGDATEVNVTVQLAKETTNSDDNKVTYEVHPEAVISVTGQADTTVTLTNDQITGTFTFKLAVPPALAGEDDKVNVTHKHADGTSENLGAFTVDGAGNITITGIKSFSEFELVSVGDVTATCQGASLRRRVRTADQVTVVNTSTDYRVTFDWTDSGNNDVSVSKSTLQWSNNGGYSWHDVAINNTEEVVSGTTRASVVITGIPSSAFNTTINTRLCLKNSSGVEILTVNGPSYSVRDVADKLSKLQNNETWSDYGKFLLGTYNIESYTLERDGGGEIIGYFINSSGN
jgi:hypothetical protein